jgi:glycosyltransferase involved in cell wall biosynthesis
LGETFNCISNLKLKENIEFIFIDDGSTDNSYALIKQFASKSDLNILLIKNSENQGYGFSCNKGIDKASGFYISIFEPDDFLLNDFYARLLAEKDESFDIIKFNGLDIFTKNPDVSVTKYKYKHIRKYIFWGIDEPGYWINHPTITNGIYKKDFLDKNGIRFCKGRKASFQDAQFSVSLYLANPKIKIIDESKYKYRRHPDQSTAAINHSKVVGMQDGWQELKQKLQKKHLNQKTINYINMQILRQLMSFYKKSNPFFQDTYSEIIKSHNIKVNSICLALKYRVPLNQIIYMLYLLIKLRNR